MAEKQLVLLECAACTTQQFRVSWSADDGRWMAECCGCGSFWDLWQDGPDLSKAWTDGPKPGDLEDG